MIIRNVKYSYQDTKYQLGPYLDFYAELEVETCDYEDIVNTIQELHSDITDVKVLSFKR